jgi:PAS domain S-box-containing protein
MCDTAGSSSRERGSRDPASDRLPATHRAAGHRGPDAAGQSFHDLFAQQRRSDERFSVCLENVLDCFGIFSAIRDEDGRIRDFRIDYLNRAACQNNVAALESQLGRGLCEVLPAHRTTGLFDAYVRVVETGQTLHLPRLEYQDLYDGRVLRRCFELRAFRLDDGFASAWREIPSDEPAVAPAAPGVSESERRLRHLADSLPQLVWTALPDGTVNYYNHRAREYAGIRETAAGVWTWEPVLHPDDTEHTVAAWTHALQTGQVYQAEHRLLLTSGEFRWHLSRGVPQRDEAGRVTMWFGTATDIHDVRVAKEALLAARLAAESNAGQLRAVLESIGDALVVLSPAGKVLYANPAARRLYAAAPGSSADATAGSTPTPASAGDAADSVLDGWSIALPSGGNVPVGTHLLARALRGEAVHEEEHLLRRGSRELIASLSAHAVLDPGGRVGRVLLIARDVSAAKIAERGLRESEQQLRLATDAMQALVYDWDVRGHSVRRSGSLFQLIGFDPAEVPPDEHWWLGRVHPDDVRQLRPDFVRSVNTRQAMHRVEYRVRHRDGHWVWVWDNARFIYDDSGELVRSIGCTVSIDARKRAEQAVRDSEDRLRVALQNSQIVVYTTDCQLRYTWIYNPHPQYRGATIIGKTDDDLLPPASAREFMTIKRRVLETGVAERHQMAVVLEDGERIYDVTLEPTRGPSGEVTGLLVSALDLTEALAARRAAEQANRAKDHFLAVLSHELRTPLTPVLSATQLLRDEPGLSDAARDLVELIRRNIELETRLIDDLLDLTRISRGKLELHKAPTDLHETIRNTLSICDGDVRGKGLRIDLTLEANPHHLLADAARVQQVLWNLLKNACKFTSEGGHVALHTRNAPGGGIELVVRDSGIGIEPDRLERIFDAFEQGDPGTTRLFGGLGLGLAISRMLVTLHGGSLVADSEGRGRGSTFTATFPAEAVLGPDAQQAPRSPSHSPQVGSLRLLLVEDHADTARLMALMLRRAGHVVRTAESVATALRAAGGERFDVVISDIGLPDGSGLDLMRQLRGRSSLKGIALSGYGRDEDVRSSLDAGFHEHLIKPLDIDRLLEAIRRVMQQP